MRSHFSARFLDNGKKVLTPNNTFSEGSRPKISAMTLPGIGTLPVPEKNRALKNDRTPLRTQPSLRYIRYVTNGKPSQVPKRGQRPKYAVVILMILRMGPGRVPTEESCCSVVGDSYAKGLAFETVCVTVPENECIAQICMRKVVPSLRCVRVSHACHLAR